VETAAAVQRAGHAPDVMMMMMMMMNMYKQSVAVKWSLYIGADAERTTDCILRTCMYIQGVYILAPTVLVCRTPWYILGMCVYCGACDGLDSPKC